MYSQVHQSCLQRWVDEKQRGNSLTKVSCPQCNTEYIIVFPDMGEYIFHVIMIFSSLFLISYEIFSGQIVMFLDSVDTAILKICPFLAAGVLAGAVYWTAITYGAITIMQVSILDLQFFIIFSYLIFYVC